VRAWWDGDADAEQADDELDALLAEAEATAAEVDAPVAGPADSGRDFVHLHVHSEYSLLDGLSPVPQLVAEAKRRGMRALALTDHGNLYGAIDFYSAARAAGIKPIVGLEAYVSPRGMVDKSGAQDRNYFHLVLLAKNRDGYQNLLKLVSRSHLEGYYYKPRLDRALLEEHANGLIALSACYSGEPSRAILDGDPTRAREAASWYRDVFGEDYFLELQDHGLDDDQRINSGLLEIHRELGIPIVATNDSHYATLDKADAQDILLCIQTNSVINDPQRLRMQPPAFYLKTPDEMWEQFGHLPEALSNTVAIAERCDLSLDFGRLNFPALDHVVPAGQTPQAFLAQTCRERLGQRYGSRLTTEHSERLEYELQVVESTGFAAYILFVWDFVDWARRRGITCGPRGSAAGSIILYCLGVSDVDPVGFGLTFERFLNPERIQMPDIDMDFADDRRDEVIQYVVDRYGRERVAQIITFGRLLARAAIRDVGRALDYPLGEVDRVAKLVPTIPIGLKLDQAIEQSPELKRLYESDPNVTRLIDTARSVEGVARHAGTHAAGVVVADQPLVEYVPLQRSSRGDSVMTQYHMKTLEKIGLLKMDFLGLANLTMLAKALENIRQRTGQQIDLGAIDFEDPTTYAMLSRGETRTVFQLEGAGMTRYIQELKPSTIDHLAAMVALYRPGPMAHIPSYIARREGREPAIPPDPSLEQLLRESYGVIVYQDQVLQVVRKLAGYSLGQADVLRRAMGKKDRAVMAEEGPRFIAAAVEHGYPKRTAEQLWDLLQPFAGYAFNKAHAYCYAFVAYQTAYLKANHPVEWFAAVLTTVAEDTEKVVGVVGECRRLGIAVLPPDINRSRLDFTVEPLGDASGIRFGLGAIKNVGEGAVELIQAERDRAGEFRNLEDFCRRLDLHTVNKRVLESLAKAGALDAFGGRQSLLASLDNALTAAQRDKQAAEVGQVGMFDVFGADTAAPPLAFAASAIVSGGVEDKRQHAVWEKEALGFNFADHPFREAALWLTKLLTHNTGHVTNELGGEKVRLGGIVTGVRRIVTRSRDQMCILTLEDLHGSVEAVVFPRTFDRFPDLWREELILIVDGKVDTRNDKPQLVVERVEAWQRPADGTPPPSPELVGVEPALLPAPADGHHAAAVPTNGSAPEREPSSDAIRHIVSVRVPRGDDATCLRTLEQLHALVERWPGDARLELTLFDRDGIPVRLEGGDTAIGSNAEVRDQLQALVGAENVAVRLLESDERAHAQLVS
jgi:DNA polymerase-3 subunit alpha